MTNTLIPQPTLNADVILISAQPELEQLMKSTEVSEHLSRPKVAMMIEGSSFPFMRRDSHPISPNLKVKGINHHCQPGTKQLSVVTTEFHPGKTGTVAGDIRRVCFPKHIDTLPETDDLTLLLQTRVSTLDGILRLGNQSTRLLDSQDFSQPDPEENLFICGPNELREIEVIPRTITSDIRRVTLPKQLSSSMSVIVATDLVPDQSAHNPECPGVTLSQMFQSHILGSPLSNMTTKTAQLIKYQNEHNQEGSKRTIPSDIRTESRAEHLITSHPITQGNHTSGRMVTVVQ